MANGTNSMAAGPNGTQASGNGGIAWGNNAQASATNSIAMGTGASVASGAADSMAMGDGAACAFDNNGGEQLALGGFSSATNWRGTALGWKAVAGAISATAIGRGARAMYTHTIAIGRGAWANATQRIVIGFFGGNAAVDVYFDNGDQAIYTEPTDGGTVTRAPASCPVVIHGMSGKDNSPAPGVDLAGGDVKIAGGQSTGTAAGGSVKLQTAAVGGASNNTENALADRLVVYSTGVVEVVGTTLRVKTSKTPSSASDTGTQGDFAWDSSFFYICTATNTWKRVAIATW